MGEWETSRPEPLPFTHSPILPFGRMSALGLDESLVRLVCCACF